MRSDATVPRPHTWSTRRERSWESSTTRWRSSPARPRHRPRHGRFFAEHGAKVVINDLDADAAEESAGEIAGETAVFAGDLTKPGIPEALINTVVDAWAIDIVVNNAGYTIDAPARARRRGVPADARHPHRGAVPRPAGRRAAHAGVAQRERADGVEVFRRSSTSGWSPAPPIRRTGQCGRQGGVVGLDQDRSPVKGQFKINVNAVAFGFIDTRLTAPKVEDNQMEIDGKTVQLGIPEPIRDAIPEMIPIGRRGRPGGGRGRRVLPLLPVVELRARAGAQRHGRPRHGDGPGVTAGFAGPPDRLRRSRERLTDGVWRARDRGGGRRGPR